MNVMQAVSKYVNTGVKNFSFLHHGEVVDELVTSDEVFDLMPIIGFATVVSCNVFNNTVYVVYR